MNEKDVSHLFMTMKLTCVTMVGWADVPDSEQGDFRRRCAVDISSYTRYKCYAIELYHDRYVCVYSLGLFHWLFFFIVLEF